MKYYISGPMTGLPDFNYPAFDAAAAYLRSIRCDVASPSEIDGGNQIKNGEVNEKPYEYYLHKALLMQLDCTAWVGLEGWTKSKGARREFDIALDLNHQLFLLEGPATVFVLRRFE